MVHYPGETKFIERDALGEIIRTWSEFIGSAKYSPLPPNYILDKDRIKEDWTGSADSINGATGDPYSFIDLFTNYETYVHGGRVIVPQGFLLMDAGYEVTGRTDRYRGDTVDQLNLNRVRICEFAEDSEGNYFGNPLGVAFKHYYQPLYGRQLSEPVTIVHDAAIKIPYFESSAATGGREIARLVTQITALAKNTNTDTAIGVGDYVTCGTGRDRGRFIKIGASNVNSQVIGQVVAIDKVDNVDGVRGFMGNKQFDPFLFLREGSWYTDTDITDGFNYPRAFFEDYRMPPYSWFGRGITGLTDGASYRATVVNSAEFTAAAGGQDAFTVDIGPFLKTFGSAKIVRADGTEIATGNAFATTDVTILNDATNPVLVNGAADLAGAWTVTAVQDNTVDEGYAQRILVTFTRGAGNVNAGETVSIPFSVLAKGQHTGLPVNLDHTTAIGVATIQLKFK